VATWPSCAGHHHSSAIHRRDRRDLCRTKWTTENVLAFVVSPSSLPRDVDLFPHGRRAAPADPKSGELERMARLATPISHANRGGIIVSVVADELVLKHPHVDLKTVLSAIGGLLFLFGTILFKHSFRGFLQLAGSQALCVLAWFASRRRCRHQSRS
jgi:hypothetical protein